MKKLSDAEIYRLFKPELSPKKMLELGVFGGSYFGNNIKENISNEIEEIKPDNKKNNISNSLAEDIFGDEQTFPFVAGLGKNAAH